MLHETLKFTVEYLINLMTVYLYKFIISKITQNWSYTLHTCKYCEKRANLNMPNQRLLTYNQTHHKMQIHIRELIQI